jgi:GT2 family glycosyltransferase
VKLIVNGDNSGFAKANIQGIKASTGRNILLLNPDTLVYPGALLEMVQFLDKHPEAGAVGPQTLGAKRQVLESWSDFPGLKFIRRGLGVILAGSYEKEEEITDFEPRKVDWVGGACLMVKKEALEQVGFLDEKFFMYWEEADLCFRLAKKGWQTYYLPRPQVVHYQGRSAAKEQEKIMFNGVLLQEWGRSTAYFIRKHYPIWVTLILRFILTIFVALSLFLWSILYLIEPRKRKKAREVIKAYSLVLGIIRRPPPFQHD